MPKPINSVVCGLLFLAVAIPLAFHVTHARLPHGVVVDESTPSTLPPSQEGDICEPGITGCTPGLGCRCLALNRGLHACLAPDSLRPPAFARAWERRGLGCASRLPEGARPFSRPPLIETFGGIIDPRNSNDANLSQWASGPAHGFYTQYILIHAPNKPHVGVPILAGPDVPAAAVEQASTALAHLLLVAARSDQTVEALAKAGVRLLLAGSEGAEDGGGEGAWQLHPEVTRRFASGLGGGAPWFPSVGITAGEGPAVLAEELFHTIQYVAMNPQQVCMYHRAYAEAVAAGLYTTDGSGEEADGEPVPTVQADEYLAMALQRWLGNGVEPEEYRVPGNDASATGRERLRAMDPQAFCILSEHVRSDDVWNPIPDSMPWRICPNRGMELSEVDSFCDAVLKRLRNGCPGPEVNWPHTFSDL